MNSKQILDLIEEAYSNNKKFIVSVNGEISIEENEKVLQNIGTASPLIVESMKYDTLSKFKEKIKEKVSGCAEYIDYYGDFSDNRISNRYNTCLSVYKTLDLL